MKNSLLVLVTFAGVIMESGGASGEDIQQFTRLHALIKPQSREDRWLQIPWMNSLWEARQTAAAKGKPILLWEMDGHPLGCT